MKHALQKSQQQEVLLDLEWQLLNLEFKKIFQKSIPQKLKIICMALSASQMQPHKWSSKFFLTWEMLIVNGREVNTNLQLKSQNLTQWHHQSAIAILKSITLTLTPVVLFALTFSEQTGNQY